MSVQIKSILKFRNYIVKEVSYKTNDKFQNKEQVTLDFSFSDEYKCLFKEQI